MKKKSDKFLLAIGIGISICLTLAAGADAAEKSAAEEARKAVLAWAAAGTTGDVDKVMAHYDPSDETVVIISAGVQVRGSAEIKKVYKEGFEEVSFDKVTLSDLKVYVRGEAAFATCRYVAELTGKSGDKERARLTIRTSLALAKIGGKWLITLEHSSPIRGVERYLPIE